MCELKTDHLPIHIYIKDTSVQEIKLKWDLKNSDWTAYRSEIEGRLSSWATNLNENTHADDAALEFQEIICQTAEQHLRKKRICKHSRPFFNEELKQLKQKVREARKRYRFKCDPQNHRNLQYALQRYSEKYELAKSKWWDDKCQNLNLMDQSIWRTVDKIKNGSCKNVIQPIRLNNGEYAFDDKQISDCLADVHIRRNHVATHSFDNAWYERVTDKVNSLKQIEESCPDTADNWHAAQYNSDITESEVRRAIELMKRNSSPGPDGILPIMLLKSGPHITSHLCNLFQSCWSQGHVPVCWKRDNRIYIPKPGKEDYHNEKAYRPLSLNSVVGKLYERIPTLRLIWFLESTYNIDIWQFSYRKHSSTIHALLHMIQTIKLGFNDDACTVAALIDLEGAFDAIWRDGVVFQLYEAGITGRLLRYVISFFHKRASRNLVNSYESEWIDTSIGVPQGSILAPILFIFYVRDMTRSVPVHIKYADDLTAMATHRDPDIAASHLSNHIAGVLEWNQKWRLMANPRKSEVMCFTKKGNVKVTVHMGPSILKQVTIKPCLGVVLDNNLTFDQQAERAASSAIGAITKLGPLLNERGGVRAELGIALYKAYIRPLLEYGYSIWSCANQTALEKVERAHRIALLKITGCTNSTPTEAMEILTNIVPIQLRLKETSCLEFLRLCRKPENHPSFTVLDNPCAKAKYLRVQTPVNIMKANLHNIARDLNPALLEKFHCTDNHLIRDTPIKAELDTGQNLGSSHSRTKDQTDQARTHCANYLANLPESTMISFTDGSALGNPGPCGAGAVVYQNGLDSHPVSLHCPVSMCSTSYHGELKGILLALNHALTAVVPRHISEFVILSDCKSAIQTACSNTPQDSHIQLTTEILSKARGLSEKGIHTIIKWVPGHAGIHGNELADQAAKMGALEAKSLQTDHPDEPLTTAAAKRAISNGIKYRWQSQWNKCQKAHALHEFHKQIPTSGYKSITDRSTEKRLFRLKSGFTHLNSELYKYGYSDSPLCSCGLEEETIPHLLLNCPHYLQARDSMVATIETGYVRTNTEPHQRCIDTKVLLGTRDGIKPKMKSIIDQALVDFVKSIPRPM